MNTLSWIFLGTVFAGLLLELWLNRRQARHVAAHADRVPDEFADRIALEQHQKAAAYTAAKLRFSNLGLIVGVVLLLGWTLGGGLELLRTLWAGLAWPPLWQGVGLILSTMLLMGLLDLPMNWWNTFRLEARFGFNRSTPGRFLLDQLLAAGLALLLGTPLIAAMLWLMAASGDHWWLYAWALWVGFTLLLSWAFPTLIAPLFNKFSPLDDGELKQRLESLLARCGFASRGMYVVDGSRRSAHGNAYFTGFGRSKRIVFYDTLLEHLNPVETEAVLAHELGHFHHRHIVKRLLGMGLFSLLGFALLGWLIQQPWFFSGLGIGQPDNASALLLFLLVLPSFTLFLSPLGSWWSRRHEFQADEYAVAKADGQQLIQALVKLYRDNANTLTPDPLYSAFHHSHPPAPVRIGHISTKLATQAGSTE